MLAAGTTVSFSCGVTIAMRVAGTTVSFSCGVTLVACPVSKSVKAGQSDCSGPPKGGQLTVGSLKRSNTQESGIDHSNCRALPALYR